MKKWIADSEPSKRLPAYTRANAGEVLPDPASPLGWTLAFEHGLLGWRRAFVDLGIYREDEMPTVRPPFAGLFGGYFYLNFSHLRLFSLRMGQPVEQTDLAFVGKRADTPPYEPHPEDVDEEATAKATAMLGGLLMAADFPEATEDRERLLRLRSERPDLTGLSDSELVARARALLDEVEITYYRHTMSTLPASVGPGLLAQLCESVGRAGDTLDLIGGLGDVDSASPASAMWDLSRQVNASAELSALFDRGPAAVLAALPSGSGDVAELRAAFDGFLADYGDRGTNEWDIYAQAWEVAPEQAIALIDSLRRSPDSESPANRHERLAESRQKTASEIRAALGGDDTAVGTFDMAMHAVDVWVPGRERTKANCVAALHEIRMAIRELGRRGVEAGRLARPGDVMMLLADELDDYVTDPDGFTEIIRQRLVGYAELEQIDPPFFIHGEPDLESWPRRDRARSAAAAEGDVLSGVGGSHGVYTGRVRVVRDLAECEALEPGEVLVTPITDAAWTPLFLVAGAAVVDVGGMNSHAVVVCRELGIPCVISVGDGTERLLDGMEITVDGSAGTVTVLSTAPLSESLVTVG